MDAEKLQERRQVLIAESREILNKAEKEERQPTAEERQKFDENMVEADILLERINGTSRGRVSTLQMASGPNDVRVEKPEELRFLTREQRMADLPASSREKEYSELDLGKLLQLATGNVPKGDCSLERRALQEGSDQSGGFAVPVQMSRTIWDLARNRASVMRAGATTVEMKSETIVIPKLVADPTGQWKVELAEADADTTTQLAALQLVAHTLFYWIEISNELLQDAVNLAEFVKGAMAKAAALQIDYACLFGSGSGQPLGLHTDGDVSKTAAAASAYWDDLSDSMYRLENTNYTPDGVIISPRTAGLLRKLKDGDGNYFRKPDWAPAVFTTKQVPDNIGTSSNKSCIFTGEWKNMLVGIRLPFRLEVLREVKSQKFATVLMGAARLDACCISAEAFDIVNEISATWT